MEFNWNGTGFDGDTLVLTQFFSDTLNNVYLFEQNYNGFFPVSVTDNVVDLTSVIQPQTLKPNTALTSVDNISSQIGTIDALLLQARESAYNSNPSNPLNDSTQNISSFIQNTINEAVASGTNLQTAIANATSLLNNPQVNFVLSDISKSWPGGQSIIKSLNDVVSAHQATIADATDKIQRVKDFKKKILKSVLDKADQLRSIQQNLDKYETQGTFTLLTSAFPTQMGEINSILSSANTTSGGLISQYLPSASAGVAGIAQSLFNKYFGNILPKIINPIDKLVIDLQKLESKGVSILNSLPLDDFENLISQTGIVNQLSSLLNTITPVLGTIGLGVPTQITDLQQILKQLSSYRFPGVQSPTITQAINTITQLASSVAKPIPTDDPATGGSFTYSAALSSFIDLSVSASPLDLVQPNFTQSPDPSIAANQQQKSVASASQATTAPPLKRGDGVNNISDVPLKPRSKPLDGSLGDYMGAKNIPF